MAMTRPSLGSYSQQKIDQIFIGIDFGTSFTKVSYSSAPTQIQQIQTVKWDNDDFFKATILYIKNSCLYFDKPEGDCQEVRYFKYSIIEKKLTNNRCSTSNSFEELCCVFFLAHLIKKSLQYVCSKLEVNSENVKVCINMGVPLENFYEENKKNKGKYQEILNKAVCLAGGCYLNVQFPSNQVLIKSLDEIYSELEKREIKLKYTVSVFPELAAEILLYHKSPSIPEGYFIIVDIGGGTVDIALFEKEKNANNNQFNIYCHEQKVLPIGVEILTSIKTDSGKVTEIRCLFEEEFSRMVLTSYKYFKVNNKNLDKINIFFLGGGCSNEWYSRNIQDTRLRLSSANIPPFNYSRSIEEFINNDSSLLQKNQRLIISQMLAKHPDDIDTVKGYPDFYRVTMKQYETKSSVSFNERLDEILNNRYPK